MIRLTCSKDGKPVCTAEMKGVGVYLDNWALKDLAKGCAERRSRFLDALQRGGTLLFSWTNAIELCGPQGASAVAVHAFLDSVGPHWVPLELNPWKAVKREMAGATAQAPVSPTFMEAYFQERAYDLSQESGVLDLSADNFFRLGAVLHWVRERRDSVQQMSRKIDEQARKLLNQSRAAYETDPAALDSLLPPVPFDERRTATFVCSHLRRLLVAEAKAFQFKKHDGLDFCHAVLAAAYASLAALDKQWKRRVERLPGAGRLAKTYYEPELDQLVDMLESLSTAQAARAIYSAEARMS
jgi:hypothetical protein